MNEPAADDVELLRRFVAEGSEAAFAELVRRRLDLVYAAALRRVGGEAPVAEDVTQHVFVALARNARALAGRASLVGWLYTTTRFAAAQAVRTERRRRAREEEAEIMNRQTTEETAADWDRLRPVLDEAMDELKDAEREAVLLRFFAGRNYAEIGAKLSLGENAARMRVERALDELQGLLAKRGVTSTAGALAVALSSEAVTAAPAGLAASVTGAALAGGALAAAAGGSVAGGWAALFIMSKIEIGATVAIAAAIIAVGGYELRANRALRAEVGAVGVDLRSLREENRGLTTESAKAARGKPEAEELTRLRARAAQLEARPPWVAESKRLTVAAARDVGWGSAEAALETFIAASAAGDRETLAGHFAYVGEAKAKAAAAFGELNVAIRGRYGSADRLAGTVYFHERPAGLTDFQWTERGARLEAAAPNAEPVSGFWGDVDPEAQYSRPGLMWRVWGWAQLASGAERPLVVDLAYAGGGQWALGSNRFSAEEWSRIVARIDPATGEIRSGKP